MTCALAFLCAPVVAYAQTQDYSQMQNWLKMSENPGTIKPGTVITMSNWRQYKKFMPLGMITLFEGKYFWKMPQDVQIDIGPAEHDLLPKTYVAATEKYGHQTKVVHLPNGTMDVADYWGGVPFPNPQPPDQGYKLLVDNWYSYVPNVYCNGTNNPGFIYLQDRFHNVSHSSFLVVYRQTAFNTDPGVPHTLPNANGTWYTEYIMQETPQEAKYTQTLQLFWQDERKFPGLFVYVPSLRRTLRMSTTARCAPLFGSDWTNDDAKTIGFNGGINLFNAKLLGERKIIALIDYNEDYGDFPNNWLMPLGFSKPSWGKWQVRPVNVLDIRRLPNYRAGYCYGHRVLYQDQGFYYALWEDLYDSGNKLWKLSWLAPRVRPVPELGRVITNSVGASVWDIENNHATYWKSANTKGNDPFFNQDTPKQYLNAVRFGTPGGLAQAMR
ncbi:MAG: DUF1329 domain-containing protein [Candidatus Binataceae bacterium]